MYSEVKNVVIARLDVIEQQDIKGQTYIKHVIPSEELMPVVRDTTRIYVYSRQQTYKLTDVEIIGFADIRYETINDIKSNVPVRCIVADIGYIANKDTIGLSDEPIEFSIGFTSSVEQMRGGTYYIFDISNVHVYLKPRWVF